MKKFLENSIDNLVECIIIIDQNKDIEYCNTAANSLIKKSIKSYLEGRVQEFYSVQGSPCIIEDFPIVKALMGESIQDFEVLLLNAQHPDGIYFNVSASPIKNDRGVTTGAIASFHNITERWLKNNKLENLVQIQTQNTHLLKVILQESINYQTVDDFLMFSLQSLLRFLNAENGYVLSGSDQINRVTLSPDLPDPLTTVKNNELLLQLLSEFPRMGTVQNFQISKIKNKSLRKVLSKNKVQCSILIPIEIENLVCGSFVCLGQKDIQIEPAMLSFLNHVSLLISKTASKKKYEEELGNENIKLEKLLKERTKDIIEKNHRIEQLMKAKDNFMAKMSHELRTPLNAIIGYSEISLEDLKMCVFDDLTGNFLKIREAGSALLTIVNSILKLSELGSENEAININTFSIEKLIEEIKYSSNQSFDKYDKLLIISVAPELGEINSDFYRLSHCINQILTNSCKHSKSKEINLNVTKLIEKEKEFLIFKIIDYEDSIDEEVIPHIFKPFSQGTLLYSSTHSGIGLGLTIAKHMIESLGGTIKVENGDSQETIFTVRIPRSCEKILQKGLNKKVS